MRFLLLLCLFANSLLALGQHSGFPATWKGNWKGELKWYRTGVQEPQAVSMELRIQPTGNEGEISWHLIYGKETDDSRPYLLKPKDTTGVHWVIDEKNGIVLDQFWTANKFCGAFTVMNSTIINSYWLEGDNLIAEFYTLGAKPLVTTGQGTAESPSVDSYKMNGYQKAVLKKVE